MSVASFLKFSVEYAILKTREIFKNHDVFQNAIHIMSEKNRFRGKVRDRKIVCTRFVRV